MGAANRNKCCMVKVAYLEEDQIRQRIANVVAAHRDKAFCDVVGHADGLLMKRTPFQHESEVRLLYIDSDRKFEKRKTIKVRIGLNEVIEEITLDPRVSNSGGEGRRKKWLEQNGFKNAINTSQLYMGVIMVVPLYKPEDLVKLASRSSSQSA